MKTSATLKKRLITIIKDDYEECQFYIASSHMLINKIKDLTEIINQQETDFNKLRDEIGEIGIFISNAEKRLEEVEECYTKLVEALAEEKPKTT